MKNPLTMLFGPRTNCRGDGGAGVRTQAAAWIRLGWCCLLLVSGVLVGARAEIVLPFVGNSSAVLPMIPQFRFGASNDFALELWLKPANTGTEEAAVFTGDTYAKLTSTGTNGGWGLYWRSGSLQVVRKPSISATNPNAIGGSQGPLVPVSSGVWHHVVVNFQRTGVLTFYVDGVLKETGNDNYASWAYFQRTFDSGVAYQLGRDPDGTRPFKGSIDEVRIWGRIRTALEVSNAYQNRIGLSGSESGLIAYYNFNAAAATAALGSAGRSADLVSIPGPVVEDSSLAIQAAIVPAPNGDYAFAFGGSNQSIETEITGGQLAGKELTIEYWFKGARMHSAVRLQMDSLWVVSGWGVRPFHIVNTSGSNNVQISATLESETLADGQWHHIAITWKSGEPGGFKSFRDGVMISSATTPTNAIPNIPAKVWLGSYNGTSEFMEGNLDEVRIWRRALTEAEILDHAKKPTRLFGSEFGLVAYFPFNDSSATGTKDLTSGLMANFRNMGAADRVEQSTVKFGDPVIMRNPNPASAGLWVGEVSLKSVNEVTAKTPNPTNTVQAGGTFDFNILLHVDANGSVQLLKDVTIMQKPNANTNLTEIVLITDDKLLPNYQGVLKRSGKLVGARYSSAFYQFPGLASPLTGGVGMLYGLMGTNFITSDMPTNPFRHRFHPQHKNPVDLQGNPYTVTRVIEINLTGGGKVSPDDGRDRIKGVYRETFTGLHKTPLIAEGEISIERVSLVNKLNNQ